MAQQFRAVTKGTVLASDSASEQLLEAVVKVKFFSLSFAALALCFFVARHQISSKNRGLSQQQMHAKTDALFSAEKKLEAEFNALYDTHQLQPTPQKLAELNLKAERLLQLKKAVDVAIEQDKASALIVTFTR